MLYKTLATQKAHELHKQTIISSTLITQHSTQITRAHPQLPLIASHETASHSWHISMHVAMLLPQEHGLPDEKTIDQAEIRKVKTSVETMFT